MDPERRESLIDIAVALLKNDPSTSKITSATKQQIAEGAKELARQSGADGDPQVLHECEEMIRESYQRLGITII